MEAQYPGLWQTWFLQQTVAIGWPPPHFHLEGETDDSGWVGARTAATQVEPGDRIIVQLSESRVGRIGTVTSTKIGDSEWNPTVPIDAKNPLGEMGRRIEVRWDLQVGPVVPSAVAKLPPEARLKGSHLRVTIVSLPQNAADKVIAALADEANWTDVQSSFASERAISEYINSFPRLLEDGLRPYPSLKTREFVFSDRRRSDVLLLDRKGNLVIVECKQHAPTEADCAQLRHYMALAKTDILRESSSGIRGILVHGGPRKVDSSTMLEAQRDPVIELVRFAAEVDFASSR